MLWIQIRKLPSLQTTSESRPLEGMHNCCVSDDRPTQQGTACGEQNGLPLSIGAVAPVNRLNRRKSGAGPAAQKPPTTCWSALSPAQFVSDRNAALILGLGKALVNVQRCSQQTQAYRVVCVIRRVNESTLATELATRACQCIR